MKDVSQMVASQIMHSPVFCAHPDDTLQKLEVRLADKRITGMPVVEDGAMIGMITQNDLVRLPALMNSMAEYVYSELLSSGPMVESSDDDQDGMPDNLSFRGQVPGMKVREAMRRNVIACEPSMPVEGVMKLMTDNRIHRIVVAENGKPIGVISTLDVLRVLTEE